MDYGMYMAASGASTALYRQDVYSNNLANLGTTGFKSDIPMVRQRASARVEDGLGEVPSNEMLERLNAGVQLMPNRVDFSAGTPESTSSPYDVSIEGDGFFQVREHTDKGDQTCLTRDGRFVRGRDGQLVTTDGLPVLDVSGSPISIPAGPAITIDSDGTVRQSGAALAQIAVVDVADRAQLRKHGNGLYSLDSSAPGALTPAKGSVRQFSIENSAVDEIRMILQVSDAARSVEANVNVMTQSDRLNDRLINQFARVS
jgi:flagellar basal body rod protein FlgG